LCCLCMRHVLEHQRERWPMELHLQRNTVRVAHVGRCLCVSLCTLQPRHRESGAIAAYRTSTHLCLFLRPYHVQRQRLPETLAAALCTKLTLPVQVSPYSPSEGSLGCLAVAFAFSARSRYFLHLFTSSDRPHEPTVR